MVTGQTVVAGQLPIHEGRKRLRLPISRRVRLSSLSAGSRGADVFARQYAARALPLVPVSRATLDLPSGTEACPMPNLVLVIGNKAYSSWSLRPWLLMKQAGIAFEELRLSLYGKDARQTVLMYSPTGRVPVLKDGAVTIWDSLAICEYLAETNPRMQLWPADVAGRAHARSISAEMHSGFMTLRNQM